MICFNRSRHRGESLRSSQAKKCHPKDSRQQEISWLTRPRNHQGTERGAGGQGPRPARSRARIGVPQSHISKIESGRTDIRLSSLIEFARPLDLDLRHVPRAAVPAVEGVVRSTIPSSAPPGLIDAAMAVRGLDRALDAADRAQALFLNLEPLKPLGDSLQSLMNRLQARASLSAFLPRSAMPVSRFISN